MNVKLTNSKETLDITQLISSVSNSGDYLQAARTLNLSMVSTNSDKDIPSANIELGNVIQLLQADEEIFYGYVFERLKATDSKTIDLYCCDCGIYLKKNRYSYKFRNITPEDITRKICSDFQIEIGSIVSTEVKITKNFIGLDLYSIIIGSYYEASITTGKKYLIRFIGKKLNVIEKGDKSNAQLLQSGYNLLTSNVSESIKNMINSVAIFDDNNNLLTTIKNDSNIKLYGLMQEYYKAGKDGKYKEKANTMLQDIERKITVTNFGNIRCITGNAVVVQEPYTGLYGLFYIDSDTHNWKNGIYTNKLVLNFRNLMDEKDVGELPSVTSSTSNGVVANSNIQWTPESQKSLTGGS